MGRITTAEQRDAHRVRQQRWRQTEAGRRAVREAQRRHRQTERGRETVRRWNAKARWLRHGITPEQAAWLLATQGGVCAAGREPLELTAATTTIDHDHECCPGPLSCGRCIRGLVCRGCNGRVGFVERGQTQPSPAVAAYLARGPVLFPEVRPMSWGPGPFGDSPPPRLCGHGRRLDERCGKCEDAADQAGWPL